MPRYRRGDGSVMKRGRKFWISYYVNGERVREPTKARTEAEARSLLRAKIGQRESGSLVVGADKVTFADLLAGLNADQVANGRKTAKLTERRADLHLTPIFGGNRANEITSTAVDAAVARWLEDGVAPGEVNLRLAALRRAFRLALEAERISRMPRIKLLTLRNARTGFLDRQKLDEVIANLPDYLRGPALFAYLTGWRLRSEVLTLTWDRIDLEEGSVRLEPNQTKGGEGRLLFAPDELRALLNDCWDKKADGCPFVFHRDGEAILRCDRAWRTAVKKAGVPGILMHDMRRSAARNYIKAGVPERVAMALCGHRTRSIFDRYHIVAEGDLREAARRLSQSTGALAPLAKSDGASAEAASVATRNGHNLGHNDGSDVAAGALTH